MISAFRASVLVLCLLATAFGLPIKPEQEPSINCNQRVLDSNGVGITRKVKIVEKPEPKRTRAARAKGTGGIVLLRLVLNASKKVSDISVIQGLPNGLTAAATKQAERIKFEPALKDGCPISVTIRMEYSFTSNN